MKIKKIILDDLTINQINDLASQIVDWRKNWIFPAYTGKIILDDLPMEISIGKKGLFFSDSYFRMTYRDIDRKPHTLFESSSNVPIDALYDKTRSKWLNKYFPSVNFKN